jgi:pimeloyl-ACP methyl ester carboxylesterase
VYRVLARELADAGFLVMTLDFAGFGASDDPYRLGREEALDSRADVLAALAALHALAGERNDVVLVGHSMGAIEAMAVGLDDPRVSLVVAIGPPRRTAEILATEEGREYHWARIRGTYDSVYHRPMPAWFTRERFLALKQQRDIETFLPRWMLPGHVPLLLIDGSREPEADLRYLRDYSARVVPPGAHVTIEDADHYLNTGTIGDWLYYDRRAVREVVELVSGAPAL